MPKCEHGLTSKECYVCASPKHAEQAEKQEPVAVVDSTISGHIDWLCVVFPKQGTKLYTTPQLQREWVGLTLDEIDLLEELYAPPVHPDFVNDASHCLELIRHVEAKLKEKNSAT
jgi:predicted aminopeptidase